MYTKMGLIKSISKKFALFHQRLNLFQNFSTKLLQVKLHDLGEGTKEATIKKLFKGIGETVHEVS